MNIIGRRPRTAGVLVVAILIATAIGFVGPAAAQAAPGIELSINGAPFTTSPATPLLDINNLAPGRSSAGTIGVRNGYADDGDLALQAIDVHNFENGCNHPEQLAGDTSCGDPGDGAGELGDVLTLTVQFGDTIAGPWTATVFTGTVNDLKAAAHLGVTVPAGADRYLLVTAALPGPTGNEVQTDNITFGLRVNLASGAGTGGAGVAGVAVGPASGGSAHGPSTGSAGWLASTGAPVLMWGAAGVLFLCCGLLLVSFARGRRHSA